MRRTAFAAFALFVGAMGHFHGDRMFLDRLNGPRFALPVRPAAPVGPPIAERVAVVFVDGLRHDEASKLEAIGMLRRAGASGPLWADFPSYTHPAITSLATGLPPRYSGVRLNFEAGVDDGRELDTIAMRAAEAGVRVTVADAGFAPFRELLRIPAGAESIAGPRELMFLYFGDVDAAGHFEGADSELYRAAARAADRFVSNVVENLDLERDVIIVMSDHGHLARGGHGGVEPEVLRGVLVMAGRGVRPSTEIEGRIPDLAPTIALLLGIPAPRGSRGRPLVEALGWPAGPRLEDPAEASLEAQAERDALVRGAIASVLAILATIALAQNLVRRDLAVAAGYAAAFAIPYVLAGYGFSFSIPRGYAGFILETAVFGLGATVVALFFGHPRRRAEEALAMALVFGAPYAILSAYAGLDLRWLPPADVAWAVILIATVEFYGCIAFGARALFAPVTDRAP